MQLPVDLMKLKVPSRSVLRRMAVDLSCIKKDFENCVYGQYDLNQVDPYSFFEEVNNAHLIVNSRGFKSVARMFPGIKFDGEEAWVCWEEEIVNMVKM